MLLGGVDSMLPSHLEIVGGKGGICWDQDGNEYHDFVMGYGAVILGHAHDRVVKAISKQAARGQLFPSPSSLHRELCQRLEHWYPWAGGSLFFKTGSEAVTAAIRLARAYTGRKRVIRCGFHGWHDIFMARHRSWHQYNDVPKGKPVFPLGIMAEDVGAIEWIGDSIDMLDTIINASKDEVACLVVDPIQLREPLACNLNSIAKIVSEAGALLVLDEVKTGFRVGLSGTQGILGVKADITVLSKGISNGSPLSAVVTRPEIIQLSSAAKIMGTYNSELTSVAAALATLEVLQEPESIPTLWKLGQYFIDGINDIFRRCRLERMAMAVPYRWPCMPHIWFRDNSHTAQKFKKHFFQKMVESRVLLLSNHPNFICLEHTEAQIDEVLRRVERSCRVVLAGE